VPVRILLDVSASMTTGEPPKFDYGRRLAAALTYVGLVRLESLLVQPFDGTLRDPIACGGGRHRFRPVIDFLEATKPGGRSDFSHVLRKFIAEYPQRGLVIVISDFLDEQECEKPIQYLADFGHELFLIHLWGEEDRKPSHNGELELEDAETGEAVKLNFDDEARAAYVEAFDNYARSIRELAMRKGGRYIGLSTSVPIEQAIFGAFLEARGMQ